MTPLNSLTETLTPYLTTVSAIAALLVILAWFVVRLGRLRNAVHRHAVWAYCLIGIFIVPPLWLYGPKLSLAVLPHSAPESDIAAPAPVAMADPLLEYEPTPQPEFAPSFAPPVTNTETAMPIAATSLSAAPSIERPFPWKLLVAAFWLSGALFMLARLLIGWCVMRRIARTARAVTDPSWPASIIRHCRVMISDGIPAPVCWGIFKPVILLPKSIAARGNRDELEMILNHELAHVQRRDSLMNLLQRLAEALFFFHPFVWLASRRLTQERERVCDNWVVAGGANAERYAGLLSDLAQRANEGLRLRGAALFEGGLLARIRALLEPDGNRLTRLSRKAALFAALAAIIGFGAFGTIRLVHAQVQKQEQAAQEPAVEEVNALSTIPKLTSELPAPSGRVLNLDGKAVADAQVLLFHHVAEYGPGNEVVGTVRTDAEGKFAFDQPLKFAKPVPHSYAQDRYILIADHPNWAFGWANITPESASSERTITLTRQTTAEILVKDRNGAPLEGASVRLQSAGDRESGNPDFRDTLRVVEDVGLLTRTTNANGHAQFTNIPDTNVSFKATMPGYAWQWTVHREITLDPGADITGRVVDEEGKPVAGAVLRVYPHYRWHFYMFGETDANGQFEIRGIPAKGWGGSDENSGAYLLTLKSDAFTMPEQRVALLPGEERKLDLIASRGTRVRLIALDPTNEQPIPGARIQGDTASGRIDGFTGVDGVLEVTVVPGDAHFWFLSPPDGVFVLSANLGPKPIGVAIGGEPVDTKLYAPGRIGSLITLRGRVLLPNGDPAENVYIVNSVAGSLETASFSGGSGSTAMTDANGFFELTQMPDGIESFLFGVTADQTLAFCQKITPNAKAPNLETPLRLQSTETAEIVIRDENGDPRRGLGLSIWPASRNGSSFARAKEMSTSSDARGHVSVRGILPGVKYQICKTQGNMDPIGRWELTAVLIPAEQPDVPRGGPLELVVPLDPSRCAVMVMDPKGNAVELKDIYSIVTFIDGVPWVRGRSSIIARRDDGSVVVSRECVTGAKPGERMELQGITPSGVTVKAEGTYPTDGSLNLLFRTGANPTAVEPKAEAAPAGIGTNDALVKVSAPDGQPISGAEVKLIRVTFPESPYHIGMKAESDAEGNAVLKGLDQLSGYRYVEIHAPGFAKRWFPRIIPGKAISVQLDNGTRLAGALLRPDGKPAVEAEIRLVLTKYITPEGDVEAPGILLDAASDVAGRYDIPLQAGVYDVEVLSERNKAGRRFKDVRVEASETTALPETMEQAARLQVRAVDRITGEPAEGLKLYLNEEIGHSAQMREEKSRTTDANGIAVWEAVIPGKAELWPFQDPSYARWWSGSWMTAKKQGEGKPSNWKPQHSDGVNQLFLEVNKDTVSDIIVERAVIVSGRVLAPDGKPVEKARVDVCATGRTYPITGDQRYAVNTDAEGRYRLSIPAGNGVLYNIVAHDPQNRWGNALTESFSSNPGDAFSFDLKLAVGGIIKGRVTNEAGQPVPKMEVQAQPEAPMETIYYYSSAMTDENGMYRLVVRPGVHIVSAGAKYSEKRGKSWFIDVKEGETSTVDLPAPQE